jgi:hypothetical protein
VFFKITCFQRVHEKAMHNTSKMAVNNNPNRTTRTVPRHHHLDASATCTPSLKNPFFLALADSQCYQYSGKHFFGLPLHIDPTDLVGYAVRVQHYTDNTIQGYNFPC